MNKGEGGDAIYASKVRRQKLEVYDSYCIFVERYGRI